ncbi:MAG: hypothetical protein QGD94_09720, partial [Planctomycetia bacterium]|nr:hypothetical protein [Planctomycetia bacterium]
MSVGKRFLLLAACAGVAAWALFPAEVLGEKLMARIRMLPPRPPLPLPPAEDPYSTTGVKPGDDCIFLAGGDRISGRIVAITPDGVARMTNPDFPNPLSVRLSGIRRITFARKSKLRDGPDEVVLANGNRIRGDVREITSDWVMLQSKAMGGLRVKRSAVARVDFLPPEKVVFSEDFSSGTAGPFKVRSGKWQVRGGKYHCTSGGHVSAPLAQSGPMTFEWTVSGLTSRYGCGLLIFAKDPAKSYGTDSIWIRPRSTSVLVYRVTNNRTMSIMSKSMGRTLSRATFRATYDPASGRLHVWVNGKDLGGCQVNPVIKTGKHIILYSHRPVVYESVRVTTGAAILPAPRPGQTDTCVVLANT